MKRYSGQWRESLDDFYGKATSDGIAPSELGQSMVKLIHRIDSDIEYEIWGLTSLFQLILLPTDDFKQPWKIKLSAQEYSMYRIEYLVPSEASPWENSYAEYMAESIDNAIFNIRVAIEFSGLYNKCTSEIK